MRGWWSDRLRQWHATALFAGVGRFAARPMEASGRPALVFAPHQDDETFGCGGLIALKRARGVAVTVVFLTDGAGSRGPAVAARRQREAIAAATVLGLGRDDLHFLGYPDEGLAHLSAPERRSAIERMARILRASHPGEVFVPHRHDRHVDHEAAYALAVDAVAQSDLTPELFQYPIWAGWWSALGRGLGWRDLAGARRLSIAGVRDRKRRAIAAYRSQLEGLPSGFARRFTSRNEIFFVAPRGGEEP